MSVSDFLKSVQQYKKIVQVHLPVMISPSIAHTINTDKILKLYERLCSLTYTRYIVKAIGKRKGIISLTTVLKLVPLILVGKAIARAILHVKAGSGVKDALIKTLAGIPPQPLLEQYTGSKGLSMTQLVVDEILTIQYISHLQPLKHHANPKDILKSSLLKNMVVLLKKMEKTSISTTDIETYGLGIMCYVLSETDLDELEQELVDVVNLITVDFATETVKAELAVPDGKVEYSTTVDEILRKPEVETISIPDLISLLKNVKKES